MNKIAIDLGCANLVAARAGEGIIRREPSVIAINRRTGTVLAVGNEVQSGEMIGDAGIVLMRPFRCGMTSNADVTYHVLSSMLKRSFDASFRGARLLLSVPCDIDAIGESVLIELALKAGVRSCHLIYSPIAAMAAGFISPFGQCLLVDIGAARTNIMLLCQGDILYMKTVSAGGEKFDSAIVSYLLKKHKLQISLKNAEMLKMKIGTVWLEEGKKPKTETVTGKSIEDGAAKSVAMRANEMYEALEEPMAAILEAVCIAVSKIPLAEVNGVFKTGILMCGGGANLSGIARMVEGVTGVKTTVMESPCDTVAMGLARIEEWLPSQVPDSVRNLSGFYIENFLLMK